MTATPELASYLAGLALGASLIVAIGAQNAYVLRQGLRREHLPIVVAVCIGSDAALIVAGVAGLGALVTAAPGLLTAARWLGGLYIIGFGLLAARRAWRPTGLGASGGAAASRRAVLATTLALTWLNPHVYLDTVVMLGTIATTRGAAGRWWFAGGAVTASVGWFLGLAYGARALAGPLGRPGAWRVVDAVIAVVMVALGVSLIAGA